MPDYKLKNGSILSEEDLLELAQDNGMTPGEFLEANKDSFDIENTTDLGQVVTEPNPKTREGIQAIVDSVVPENSQEEIARRFFNLEANKTQYTYGQIGGEDGKAYSGGRRINAKSIEEYLGKNYPLYEEYQKTGKLDLTAVPDGLIDNVITELKSKTRNRLYEDLTDEERQQLTLTIPGTEEAIQKSTEALGAKAKPQTMVPEYSSEGMVMVPKPADKPASYDILRTEEFKQEREKQRKSLLSRVEEFSSRVDPYLQQQAEYEKDQQEFEQNISGLKNQIDALGEVNEFSNPETIEKYNSLVIEYQNNFQAEANRLSNIASQLNKEGYAIRFDQRELDKEMRQFQIGEEEIAGLVKNYSKLNLLDTVLEKTWADMTVYLAKFGQMGLEGMGGPQNVATTLAGMRLYENAIDYSSKLQDQMELFPDPLKLGEGNDWSDLIADSLIRNSPSIIISGATIASGGILGAANAAYLSGSSFFLMSGGSKLSEMEISQENAPKMLESLRSQLENVDNDYDRNEINKQIRYYEEALTYTDLQKAFVATTFGAVEGGAEAFGNLALFKNIGKMGRSYGTDAFRSVVGDKMGRIMAKGVGLGAGLGGGIGIEITEETLTQLGHNFIDITALNNKDKSLIEGIDADFFFNTALSSLAIQGGPAFSNMSRLLLSETASAADRSQFLKMQKEHAQIQAQLNSDKLTAQQRLNLRERRRALNVEMARKAEVTIASASALTTEEGIDLFNINAALRQNAQDAIDAGLMDETGSYKDNLLNRLNQERNDLMAQREKILKDINIPVEFRGTNQKFDATTQYRFGRYNLNKNLINGIKGYNQYIIKGKDKTEWLASAEEIINDPNNNFTESQANSLRAFAASGANGAYESGKYQFINEGAIYGRIMSENVSEVDKERAMEAPVHEYGHAYMLEQGLAKKFEDIDTKNLTELKTELKNYFEQKFKDGLLSQKDKEAIDLIIAKYEKEQPESLAEEIAMIIGDLSRAGRLKNTGSASLYSVKKFTKNLLSKFFGKEKVGLFKIDTVEDALDFLAKLQQKSRARASLQLPPEDQASMKASLSSGNMVVMSESQLAKVKESLDKLGRDEDGKFDKDKFDPNDLAIFNALPGMIIAQAKKRAIKGLQFDMEELVQETLLQLLKRQDVAKFDGTKNNSLYGYLNKFIKWRIGDAFNTNPSIVTDFGEASMEDLTTQFSQEESEDVVTRQEAEVKDVPRTPGLANNISFANRLNKMQPGLINNEVRDNIFKALDKFLNTQEGINGIKLTTRLDWQKSDTNQATDENGNKLFVNVFGEVITQREREALPANEKEKFEALMNQKLTLQPEEQKDLRAMLNKFLEQELTKYLQKEIIAPPRSPRFKNLVESSFELYKIIPQSFLNDRIESWIQPKLGPDGKQMRETVAEAGEYGGAKGNPIFERKEITKEEWENYWLAPGKPASSQGKLKERFAALIAQEYGKDLLIEFLNDESKLEMFLSQQKLPSVNQLDNLGVQLITALERDPGAFKVKYSLSAEDAPIIIAEMPNIVNAAEKLFKRGKFNPEELEKEFAVIFGNRIPLESIKGLAKFFNSNYKTRRLISYGYKKIKALTEETRLISLQEALAYKAFGRLGNILSFYTGEKGFLSSYYTVKKKRILSKATLYGMTNRDHAIDAIQSLVAGNVLSIVEVWQYLGQGLNSGTSTTVFQNNIEFYNAFEKQFEAAGISLDADKGRFIQNSKELNRANTTKSIQGPAMLNAINKNSATAYALYEKNALDARDVIEKIIIHFESLLSEKGITTEQSNAIKHKAAVLFTNQSGVSDGLLRKIAILTHVETGITNKNAMFEHMLPANVISMLIGDRLNKQITSDKFKAIIKNGAVGVLTDRNTTEKVVNMFFKNNMPMDVDVRSDNFDAYARYRNSMVAPILQGKTLQGLAGNETIVFAEAPHINSAKQIIESRKKQKDRSRKKYSLNTDDIVDFNPLESGLFPDSKTTEWYSDPIKIGPLQDDQAYMMYLSVTQRNDGQPYLMFNFTLYDGEHQHSTALEGNFAGKSINPFRLFGTIGNSVIHFLENNREFEGLEFSGSGNSRIRLYNRLAKMLAKKLGWNLDTEDITIAADDDGNDVEYLAKDYYISKPKAKYSLSSLDKDFNLIIEDKFGIEEYKRFSQVVGKRRGAKIDKFNLKNWWFPPSAEDFMGLMYDVLAKGAKGDAQKQWIVDNLVIPYTHGIAQIDKARQSIKRTYRNLLAENKGITKLLQQKIEDGDYTYDQAIRVYMWNKQGDEIAGLSERDRNKLVAIVEGSQELKDFISVLMSLPNLSKGWPKPSEYWDAQTILSDLNNLTEKTNRKEFLAQFIENADVVFSEQNMNKLRAAVGNNWVEAMEDILYRMKNGTNRPSGSNRIVNAWNNWVNRSIGAIMFFNRRSAVLQTLSTVNFINWSDNNPIKAAAAFANQKQYWKDFAYIFNSDKLKERRGGLRTDVSEAEIANQADLSKGDPGAILSYLLKIGFSLTQIADSFAIASGGATFYRNRINTYVKEGLTQKEAEEKAWSDFSRISDETQQSSDPMLISQEQASVLGRLVLAFQNTSAQYTRRGRKGIRDLITGRGDFKTNLSVSIYYLAVQNVLFNALQNALFTFIPGFDDEPEDETLTEKELERKQQKDAATLARAINGSLDTILRGMGVRGAAIATLKNTIMKYYEQEEKDPFFKDNAQVVLEALNISPPIGSKARKLYNGLRTKDFEKDVIEERGFDLFIDGKFKPSPTYSVIGNIAAAVANVPLDRMYDETVAIAEAFDSRNSAWQRLALGLGYKTWTVGAKFEEEDLIKERAKALRKEAGIEKAKETRKKNKRKADSLQVIKRYNETKDLTADEYIEYVKMELLKKKKNK
jgi:hypothetical protein